MMPSARSHGHSRLLGVVIHVPADVTLSEPIVLRWRQAVAGRGLISRTIVTLGKNTHATIFEEQVGAGSDGSASPKVADSFWWGTTEVDLADGATLDFAGEQDFGTATAAFVTRQARVGDRRHHQLGHRERG